MIDNARQALEAAQAGRLEDTIAFLKGLIDAEQGPPDKVQIKTWVFETFSRMLLEHGIRSGTIAEIGGSRNSFLRELPDYKPCFLSIFPTGDPECIVADITNCPHIPDESFDVVFSISVFEHLTMPWQAAREITRILKPNGITFHVMPFSYFYHKAPIDFWRMTPDALAFMFGDLEPLLLDFYTGNRRRDNRGKDNHRVDSFGYFAVDAFGGWRENVHAVYAGKKVPGGRERRLERLRNQLVIDTVRAMKDRGMDDDAACVAAVEALGRIGVDEIGNLRLGPTEPPSLAEVRDIWGRRGKLGLKPSHNRHVIPSMLNGFPPAPAP